jgi:hypothetical protein
MRQGGTVDVPLPTASFVYDNAPGHQHFHFLNWTKLRLRAYDPSCPSSGWAACPEIVSGRKISFCIVDFAIFDSSLFGGAPKFNNCLITGGTIDQGISVGLQDIYEQHVFGQVVDLTNVAPGQYWLEAEVNPNHVAVERDYTNNVARVVVTVQ